MGEAAQAAFLWGDRAATRCLLGPYGLGERGLGAGVADARERRVAPNDSRVLLLGRSLLIALCSICSAACGVPEIGDRVTDYEQALRELVPDAEAVATPTPASRLPGRRDRQLEASDQRIGVFDFLAIQGCSLSQVVGRRNSSLGRLMVPSQQLIYELELLRVLGECAQTLSPERASRFDEILVAKRRELPRHVWNAVWLGAEMEAYLSSAPPAFARSGDGTDSLHRALDVLEEEPGGEPDGERLERALNGLRTAFPTGALLGRLAEVREGIDRSSILIERASRGASCGIRERRLVRVFEERFVPMQGEISKLAGRIVMRLDLLDRLFVETAARVVTPPSAMQRYHAAFLDPEHPSGLYQLYRASMSRHVSAWKPILVACGRLPS